MNHPGIILIGGGGHCKSCIDVVEASDYRIEGILDIPEKVGGSLLSYAIIGSDREIGRFNEKGFSFLVTLGQTKTATPRRKLFELLRELDATVITLVSPAATVSKHAFLGDGTIALHKVVVNAGATVGDNVILNTGVIVEHDVTIGSHTHISTGAIVNGDAGVGEMCLLGSRAVVKEGVHVCSNVVVGAGAVVVKDIQEPGTYVGCPAILQAV